MKKYKTIAEDVIAEYDEHRADNSLFWANQWTETKINSALSKAKFGYLAGMDFLLKRIEINETILEAGCGKGQNVAALKSLGFRVTGIDFADSIINKVKQIRGDLDVVVGDKQFSVYLSFGVIEHFDNQEDINKIIAEAKRVTSDKLLFCVPYYSPVLAKKFETNKLNKNCSNSFFYQYYYNEMEISNLLKKYGLSPYKTVYYATYIGLKRYNKLFYFFLHSE